MKLKQKKNSSKVEKTIFFVVFSLMFLSLIYSIIMIILSPSLYDAIDPGLIKNDYLLMSIQATAGLLIMVLPSLLEKKWDYNIPSTMNIFLILFIFGGVFLGEFNRFYFTVPNWDKFLHILSGAALSTLSFSIISLLEKREIIKMNPLLIALFSFSFSIMLGVVWEFYEFSLDNAFDLNMQKYADQVGVDYVGKNALYDTMYDLIVDSIGALGVSILGYISTKYEYIWINKLIIKRN